MTLSMEFAHGVMGAMKARELKAQAIAHGIENFLNWAIQSHNANPLPSNVAEGVNASLQFLPAVEGDNSNDSQSHYLYFYANKHDENSTRLVVSTQSSGQVQVELAGPEIRENVSTQEFSADNFTVEEAVAKIITMIQNRDIYDFGPFVTQASIRLWTLGLGNKLETAPGHIPSAS